MEGQHPNGNGRSKRPLSMYFDTYLRTGYKERVRYFTGYLQKSNNDASASTFGQLLREEDMKLGFHGATTMTADLQTDVAASAHAGFKGLEVWVAKPSKLDRFLADHSLADLKALFQDNHVAPMTLNAISFIAFRGEEFGGIKEQCRKLCEIAQAIGCPAVALVASPTPTFETTWETIVEEHVSALQELSDFAGDYGIKLPFEFLGFGWCSVRTPRGAQEIINQTGRD